MIIIIIFLAKIISIIILTSGTNHRNDQTGVIFCLKFRESMMDADEDDMLMVKCQDEN